MKWNQPYSLPADHWLNQLDLEKYERQGVDISLLMANLKRTPTERVEINKEMLKFIEEARKSRERLSNNAHS